MNDNTTKGPDAATARRANISLSAGFNMLPKSSSKQKLTATQKRRALKRRKPTEKPGA